MTAQLDDGNRKDATLRMAVQTSLGITPDHVVGLSIESGWYLDGQVDVNCSYCDVPLYLFIARTGTFLDGVVVCRRCKLADPVTKLPRPTQRRVRASASKAAVEAMPAGSTSPPPSRSPTSSSRLTVEAQSPDAARGTDHRPQTTVPTTAIEALERQLRSDLRGRQLVCEIPLDHLQDNLRAAFNELRDVGISHDERRLARRFPAITASFLVDAATHGYTAGNLYDNLSVPGLDGPTLGRAFERSLDELHLERFDALVAEGALRYVARILGHTGIPSYCCDDYLGLVIGEVERGVDDASELLTRLRLAPSRLVQIDKPVGRFLLHGGEISRDFLDRTIDLVNDWIGGEVASEPSHYGLPPYVWHSLASRDRTDVLAARRGRRSTAIPRPLVTIDPWDPVGPVVVLPPVPRHIAVGTWTVSGQGAPIRARTSDLDERTIALPRARHWSVDLTCEGSIVRQSQFTGLSELQAILFDARGVLVRDPTAISLDQVCVLAPIDATVSVESHDGVTSGPRVIESYPRPGGDWHGFELSLIDLEGVKRITISRDSTSRTCWVRQPVRTPTIAGSAVSGVTSDDGVTLFSEVPRLDLPDDFDPDLWTISVIVNGRSLDLQSDSLTDAGVFEALVPQDRIAEVNIVGRGPLGSDFRSRFIVVPGLEVERPQRPILPGASRPSLTVRAAAMMTINGQAAGVPFVGQVRELGDRVAVELSDGHQALAISIVLPVVAWSLTTESGPTENTPYVRRTSLEDVLADAAPFLRVRCGLPGVGLGIEIEANGQNLYTSPKVTTTDEGRWAFDLGPAKDALRLTTAVTTRLVVRVGGIPVVAALLTQDPGVSGVDTERHVDLLEVRWSEARPVNDRVVRLWPLSRPWMSPTSVELPDGAPADCSVEIDSLDAGLYLVEVCVDDGWTQPKRPDLAAAHTTRCRLGDVDPEPEDALDVLAVALTTGRAPRPLTADEVDHCATEMLVALECQVALGLDICALGTFQWMIHQLAARPQALHAALGSSAAAGFPLAHLLALTIEATPRVREHWTGSTTTALWSASPPLAAALDLANRDPEAGERLETFADVVDLASWTADLPRVADENVRVLLSMEPEQLRAIQTAIEAIPHHVLDPETRLVASFEWLINHRSGHFDAAKWVSTHWRELDGWEAPNWADKLINSEELERATNRSYRESDFPRLVMKAACLSFTTEDPAPRQALHELRDHAPLLIARALTFAAVVAAKERSLSCSS